MVSVFKLNAAELDSQFLESLKLLFRDKTIEIVVTEVDETAYLLQSPANRNRLLQAIENVKNGKHLVETQLDDVCAMN